MNTALAEPVHLKLPDSVPMDDAQFFAFCQANADYRIERDANGEIQVMPPTGAETGRRNSGNGVRLGWLLLPDAAQVHIYRPHALPLVLDGATTIGDEDLLPGFHLDLRPIWAAAL